MSVYRPSKNAPATAWARHLDKVMQDRDWSRVRLFEEVAAELGYSGKSRSAILPLLIKKEPTEAQATVLRKHFGDPPTEQQTEPLTTEPEPSLSAALTALTDELAAMRLERATWAAWARGVAGAFRSYEGGQVSADLLDALMPPLPVDTLR